MFSRMQYKSYDEENFKNISLFSDVNQSGEIDIKDFEQAIEVSLIFL